MTIKRVNRGRYHSYVDTNTGDKIPGVTSILNDGLAKPALIGWAANTTAAAAVDRWDELSELNVSERLNTLKKARFDELDKASGRGTEVHKLAERLVVGEEIDVPDELAGHVESYVSFLDEWNVQPVLVEAVVVNYTHHYAGTFDLIADLNDGQRWLLDVKTARSGVFPDNALQLAAYRNAEHYRVGDLDEQPMMPVDATGVIHVRADGYTLVPVDTSPATFRTFLYVQQLAYWANDTSKNVVGEALNPTNHTPTLTAIQGGQA